MIVLDTSVVVPAFASWHEAHRRVVARLADEPSIPVQVAIETYSVLTRLPHPHRVPGAIVAAYLDRVFPEDRRIPLPGELHGDMPQRCAGLGIEGGAIYDAVVAATALAHDATLVTRDHRAMPTYRLIGARTERLD